MLLMISSFGIFGVSTTLHSSSPLLLSIVQSASLLSVLFCLVSVMTAITLMRHHSTHMDAHATEAVSALHVPFLFGVEGQIRSTFWKIRGMTRTGFIHYR